MTYTLKQLLNPIDSDRLETLNKIAGIITGKSKSSLLIGAFARDLLFYNLYDIPIEHGTFDMDFSIKMLSWDNFEAVINILDKKGLKQPLLPDHPEKFRDGNGAELDLIPFDEKEGEQDKATARLIGYDIGKMCSLETFTELEKILNHETASHSRGEITKELRTHFYGNFKKAREIMCKLLSGLRSGYKGK